MIRASHKDALYDATRQSPVCYHTGYGVVSISLRKMFRTFWSCTCTVIQMTVCSCISFQNCRIFSSPGGPFLLLSPSHHPWHIFPPPSTTGNSLFHQRTRGRRLTKFGPVPSSSCPKCVPAGERQHCCSCQELGYGDTPQAPSANITSKATFTAAPDTKKY